MKKVMFIEEEADCKHSLTPAMHSFNPVTTVDELLKAQIDDGNVISIKKKRIIYAEGKTAASIFYILKGKVKTSKWNEDGKELITGLYHEGDFIGFNALLDSGRYRETAEVIEDAELIIISRTDLELHFEYNSSFLRKFLDILAANIAEKQEQMLRMAYSPLRKKVAEALLITCKKYNPSNQGEFSMNISRCNLAALAGVAKESLIRTLGDLRDENIIQIKDGKIIITDIRKLEHLIYCSDGKPNI
ncbi:Crp/Fnr family transcriptional regulator [Chitinophaga varians]|uniref:Crp/Fnr family transcriptional regulator n=1 Tax=Chitinophaga varians TaxID=2202339 RepID=UPI00165FE542|nr:Crp/Fnr family transcriptional regulator [Chitinophaga varians]MBC9912615.1 Crp/Fnr family transcriptional regulator [Chitinophaga varians]